MDGWDGRDGRNGWAAWGLAKAPSVPRRARNGPAAERVGRGLYRIGPRPAGDLGWWQDAAIACARRTDCVLHGQAAAACAGLDGFEPGGPIAVAVPRSTSAHDGRVRRLERLRPPTTACGLPIPHPAELLLDLGAALDARPGCRAATVILQPQELVELAVECALRRELTTVAELRAILDDASNRRPGRSVLRRVLDERPAEAPPTESYLETRVVQALRRAGIEPFERQVCIHDATGFIGRVDFERDGIILEAAGAETHLERFHADNERYARLAALGYLVLPLSFSHVDRREGYVARIVGAALAENAPGGGRRAGRTR